MNATLEPPTIEAEPDDMPLFTQSQKQSRNVPALVEELKRENQDFEFYPTTNAIIAAMARDIRRGEDYYGDRRNRLKLGSFLDIGAGNGKVIAEMKALDLFREFYAIEKSPILCGELPAHVFVIGTAFEEQSLICKKVDVVFCNPPYSDFIPWAVKIIREAAATVVYLVIPRRWEGNVEISDALKFRDAKAHKVGEFDFEDAEDRRARAKVDLLRIDLTQKEDDAFDRFFKEQFKDLLGKFEKNEEDIDAAKKIDAANRKSKFDKMVVGASYPEAMVSLYNVEMANVQNNYRLVSELDADLLREFEVSPERILGCLKQRLKGLRMSYWNELFSRMAPITDRLTSKSRDGMLGTLQNHTQVDFTVSNIHAVIIWAIKNANGYIESQFLSHYENMVDKCNVFNYASNKRVFVERGWRYEESQEKNSHYALDLRIVMHRCGGLSNSEYSWQSRDGLEERAYGFIQDMLTIANNLGFACPTSMPRVSWRSNAPWEFEYHPRDAKNRLLFEVRAFKNGNMHLRLSKEFALALNVEHGRLKGWIRNRQNAVEELKDDDAAKYFRCTHQLLAGPNVPLLLA